MGHDNIWYSRPRKFGAGSRKCKACSNGCVQIVQCSLCSNPDEYFYLMQILAGTDWSGSITWTCAGSASTSTPRTSASRSWTSLEIPSIELYCPIFQSAGHQWLFNGWTCSVDLIEELLSHFRGDNRGRWPLARRRPGSWEDTSLMVTAGEDLKSNLGFLLHVLIPGCCRYTAVWR